jgi:hypothetical protein
MNNESLLKENVLFSSIRPKGFRWEGRGKEKLCLGGEEVNGVGSGRLTMTKSLRSLIQRVHDNGMGEERRGEEEGRGHKRYEGRQRRV